MADSGDRQNGISVDVQPLHGGGRGSRVRGALVVALVAGALGVAILLAGQERDARPDASATGAASGPIATGVAEATLEAPWPPDFPQPNTRVIQVVGASPFEERQDGPVPPGAGRLALLVGCSGEGELRMELDGVAVPFDCADRFLDGGFVPPLGPRSSLLVEASGDLLFVVELRSWSPVQPVFRPPVVELGAEGGDRGIVPGFLGCGLSYELPDGIGGTDRCGPSWMPIPDDRAVTAERRGELVLTVPDGWRLTDVVADFTDHDGIVPADRDVPYARGEAPTLAGDSATVPLLLIAGDFGLRLTVSAERDGARFTAPYYFRIIATP